MKKVNQNGAVDFLLVLVLVIVLAVGGFVYYRINTSDATPSEVEDTAVPQANEEKNENRTEADGFSYVLPVGWENADCDTTEDQYALLAPESDKAENCDDRTNTILLSSLISAESCLSDEEVLKIQESKPLEDYTCEEVTISNIEVLKSSADYGNGPSTSFTFLGEMPLEITYFSGEEDNTTYSEDLTNLANSIQF